MEKKGFLGEGQTRTAHLCSPSYRSTHEQNPAGGPLGQGGTALTRTLRFPLQPESQLLSSTEKDVS